MSSCRSCLVVLPLLLVGHVGSAAAQGIMYDAATHDSMAMYGSYRLHVQGADSAYVMVYRSFFSSTDSAAVREQALGWWSWLSAQVKVGGQRFAAVRVIWPTEPTDSLLAHGIASDYWLTFVRDTAGCWHIVNDPTPISNCGS
jgi:hypothetical protein